MIRCHGSNVPLGTRKKIGVGMCALRITVWKALPRDCFHPATVKGREWIRFSNQAGSP